MFKDNDKLSNVLVFFYMITASIEIGTLFSSRAIIKDVGNDMILASLISGICFALPMMFLMIKLAQRFYKHGPGEYIKIIAGVPIGWVLTILFAGYWFVQCIKVIRHFTTIVKFILLNTTPEFVIYIPIIILSVYIVWHGIEPIARLCVITAISIFPIVIIILAAALPNFKLDTFLPVFHKGPLPVIKAAYGDLLNWEEMNFILFLIPFMKTPQKSTKVLLKYTLPAYMFLSIYVVSISMGVLGVDFLKTQFAPLTLSLETVKYAGLFLEKLGTIFASMWIIIAFPTICSLHHASCLVLSQVMGLKSHRPIIIPSAALMLLIIIFIIPKNTVEVESFFKFLKPYGTIVIVILPILLYLTAVIRKLKDN